jgi:hypothetical protein
MIPTVLTPKKFLTEDLDILDCSVYETGRLMKLSREEGYLGLRERKKKEEKKSTGTLATHSKDFLGREGRLAKHRTKDRRIQTFVFHLSNNLSSTT